MKNQKIIIASVAVAGILALFFRKEISAWYKKVFAAPAVDETLNDETTATYKSLPADINEVVFPISVIVNKDAVLSIGLGSTGIIGIDKYDDTNVSYEGMINNEEKKWVFPYAELVQKAQIYTTEPVVETEKTNSKMNIWQTTL
jgi:hypothetical protein